MADREHPIRLKVATWNIHEGVPVPPGGGPAGELARLLGDVDPVALQEVALQEVALQEVALQEVALTPDGGFPDDGP